MIDRPMGPFQYRHQPSIIPATVLFCASLCLTVSMSTPRETRLVLYVSAELAAELRRLAALDGRTVSNWLSRLVADAAGGRAPFSPVVSTATASATRQLPRPPMLVEKGRLMSRPFLLGERETIQSMRRG